MIGANMSQKNLRAASILTAILIAAFATPVQSSSPKSKGPARGQAQFEGLPLVRTRQNHLLVRAFINDKPALLIVDTGSPGTVISSKRRAYFGLDNAPTNLNWPTRIQVNGGFSRLVMARSLRLGGLNVVDIPVVLANMSGTSQASRAANEAPVDGILGADVLFETKAVLDCQQPLLILSMFPERSSHVPGLNFRGFQRMPMHVTEGLNSYVDGSINGTAAQLMVDTGAFATLLHRPFVRQMRIPTRQTRMQSARINLADDDVDVAQIRKLSVGLVDIVGKNFGVTDLAGVLHHGLDNSPPVVGLLGGEILMRNHGIIDFGTHTLYLRRDTDQTQRANTSRGRRPAPRGGR